MLGSLDYPSKYNYLLAPKNMFQIRNQLDATETIFTWQESDSFLNLCMTKLQLDISSFWVSLIWEWSEHVSMMVWLQSCKSCATVLAWKNKQWIFLLDETKFVTNFTFFFMKFPCTPNIWKMGIFSVAIATKQLTMSFCVYVSTWP